MIFHKPWHPACGRRATILCRILAILPKSKMVAANIVFAQKNDDFGHAFYFRMPFCDENPSIHGIEMPL